MKNNEQRDENLANMGMNEADQIKVWECLLIAVALIAFGAVLMGATWQIVTTIASGLLAYGCHYERMKREPKEE